MSHLWKQLLQLVLSNPFSLVVELTHGSGLEGDTSLPAPSLTLISSPQCTSQTPLSETLSSVKINACRRHQLTTNSDISRHTYLLSEPLVSETFSVPSAMMKILDMALCPVSFLKFLKMESLLWT